MEDETEEYTITLKIKLDPNVGWDHPEQWDWRTLLDLGGNESVEVLGK